MIIPSSPLSLLPHTPPERCSPHPGPDLMIQSGLFQRVLDVLVLALYTGAESTQIRVIIKRTSSKSLPTIQLFDKECTLIYPAPSHQYKVCD